MTNTKATTMLFGIRTSQSPRTAATLRGATLMQERQRLEIACRIVWLREHSRFTQPQIAERLGLTLRGYQKIEERGTSKYERVEAIAAIHDANVDWLWEGRERPETPDVLGQLTREQALEELSRQIADLGTAVLRIEADIQELLRRTEGLSASQASLGAPRPLGG